MLPLRPWCSVSSPQLSMVHFRTPCSWDIPRERSIATRDTRSDEYWSADEVSTESQRQNRCFWKSSPQRKPDILQTSAPWQLKSFWVSLEGRSRTNSPRQRFYSQLFCKIVRYFCRTLYYNIKLKLLPFWLVPGNIFRNTDVWFVMSVRPPVCIYKSEKGETKFNTLRKVRVI